MKILFLYVNEKKKLKLVKANKCLQKYINISIINYKYFSGKYIIFESNGKGKLYNGSDESLLFEGEFKNGEKNGKGKEYYDNNLLIFEGEYLNNKRNGKGKEYYDNGILMFEGEYLNGKRNGKGKEYDFNGQLKFECEYLNGVKINGPNKTNFETKALNEKKFENNGYNPNNKIVYELKDGKCLIKEFDSFGKLKFEGEIYGKGKEYYNDGKLKFEGIYLYDYKLKGKLYINEKLEYEGEFLYNRKWNGKGYDKDGNRIYEVINGNGKVKEYNDKGKLEYEGRYLNGKKNGKGKEFDKNGRVIFEGEYLNDKKWNGRGKINKYNVSYSNGERHYFEYRK